MKSLTRLIALLIPTILACASSITPPSECLPQTFRGAGDDVVDVNRQAMEGCTKIDLSHSGDSNFIVTPYAEGNRRLVTYANEVGEYSGTARWDNRTTSIEVDADGSWVIRIWK